MKARFLFFLIFLAACLFRCRKTEAPLFERLGSDKTGIGFNNRITENDTLNVLDFEYIYNGGGVGVGDFNNDGLPDIFFSGNQVPSKLYLNKGDFRFEDITTAANIHTPYWNTGVSLVDINQDGLLDIYLCTANPKSKQGKNSPNQLFVNQGLNQQKIPVFKEMAAEVGLADTSYCTQAAFFDYDLDGDLDMYLLNNALESFDRSLPLGQRKDSTGRSTDRLYRNDTPPQFPKERRENSSPPSGPLRFTNVSRKAGITTEGWGLGVGIADLNNDGWPDVYCANDFQSNDLLWMNNRNGTFTNRITECTSHQSSNSMGVDIADINNDALPEIVTLDMMPEDNLRQKSMFSKPNYERYQLALERKYQPQFVRNSLQLNNGLDQEGNPVFSEIGYMAGVYDTDWSWSSLFADFDNDGYRDLLVTNGYKKDVTNLDFAAYNQENMFLLEKPEKDSRLKRLQEMESLLGVHKSNFIFRNRGDLTFEDVTEKWGLKIPSYSNGAAYADFDNDGDLDIVINNINTEAFLYRNNLFGGQKPEVRGQNVFLRVRLNGEKGNAGGLGAKITIFYSGKQQFIQHSPYRGYKSTVEPVLHFGLGDVAKIDSIKIVWQSGKQQTRSNLSVNQTIVLEERAAPQPPKGESLSPLLGRGLGEVIPSGAGGPLSQENSQKHRLVFLHQENDFVDFKYQNLLHRKHSQQGPGIAVGDANGDGLDDIFIGGSSRKSGVFFWQKPDGTFRKDFLEDTLNAKTAEDTGVLLFDADNDGDNDLYCVSGSSEFGKNTRFYKDRFYRNSGRGKFELDTTALPDIVASGSVVAACDYDKDGDLDLFVGGRVSPMEYPTAPRSYLLQNDGKGGFTDITQKAAPDLQTPGMVSAALWSDFDNDGWTDLVLVGEWMPITFFKGSPPTPEGGVRFKKAPPSGAGGAVGWWNSLAAGDFDNDGDIDYVAGNVGRNSLYQASEKEPVCVYAKDYDQNGTIDPVLCRYIQGKEYITHYRESLTDQIVGMKKLLTSYKAYGEKTFRDIFTDELLKDALILRATYFSSAYIENQSNGKFAIKPLPVQTQLSPVFGMIATDVNQDGNLDLLTVGNDYSAEPLTGRYDASVGTCMLGDGKGNFAPMSVSQSGFLVKGDAKAFAEVRLANGRSLLLVTQNQDKLLSFGDNSSQNTDVHSVRPDDAYAEITLANGKRHKREFYYGSTYLSQSSRFLKIPTGATEVRIFTTKGRVRSVPVPTEVVRKR